MQKLSLNLISLYQLLISPFLFNNSCRYEISCSEYTKQEIARDGLIKGVYFGIRRIISCR